MTTSNLKVQLREGFEKKGASKLRKGGFVPAVIYGHGKETKHVKLNNTELQRFINRNGIGGTINVEIEGKIFPTVIKEVQRDTISDNLLHIDFQQLSENEKVKISTSIHLIGREKVESKTTIIQQQLTEIEVQCLPKYIPQSVSVDISNMEPGDAITVGELEISKDENIEVLNDSTEIVVSLTTSSMYEEVEEEVEVPIYESDESILDR